MSGTDDGQRLVASPGPTVAAREIRVGSRSELRPGKMKRVEIAGRRILLANVDGRFYAAADTCTHEDASLSNGALRGEVVMCPLHGSRFNLRTGEVMEDPAERNLETYPVRVEGEDILVSLEQAEQRP
jgi:nitrite reductase/ring-hydroxylating ferredoxin subunit